MRKLQKTTILVALLLVIFSAVSSRAQQAEPSEKEALILEFRNLTGAQKVDISVNYSIEGVKGTLAGIVEDDKELTDEQKAELGQSVSEASGRIENLAREFFADEAAIAKISELAIFKVYDENFSDAELREMILFFRTPTGKKAAAFLPNVTSQVEKLVQQDIVAKLKELIEPQYQIETEKLEKKVKETKAARP